MAWKPNECKAQELLQNLFTHKTDSIFQQNSQLE